MIGIIGGTGLTSLPGLGIESRESCATPYGEPSDRLLRGRFAGAPVIFLARHGGRHVITPHRVNYRANLWALHSVGVRRIVAVNAVGGIARDLAPGELAIPAQIIDYTYGRAHTYFDEGERVEHVDFTHPFIRDRLLDGLDMLDPERRAIARAHPDEPTRLERHGTQMAGLIAGRGGPGGIHGVVPASRILPIRVAGWQPSAEGGFAVYGRTDQLLAGIERAVDPDADGDVLDAARIAVVGVTEPFASFPDSG